MVDVLTVLLLVFTAISTVWAILATLVPKRKELRTSLHNLRERMTQRLDEKSASRRGIGFRMIFSAFFGGALYYYWGPLWAGSLLFVLFFAWFFVTLFVFGKPDWDEPLTKSKVEELVERRLKEEREKSPSPKDDLG